MGGGWKKPLHSPNAQHFFKSKHLSYCCLSLATSQSAEMVVFVSFVQLYSCFLEQGFTSLLTGPSLEAPLSTYPVRCLIILLGLLRNRAV